MRVANRSGFGLVSLALLLAAAATSMAFAPEAHASDFWDEVKNPGLRLYRLNLAASQDALQAHRFAEARELASIARELFPDRAEAYILSGIAAGEDDLKDEMVASLTRGLELFEPGAVESRLVVRAGTTAAQAHAFELAVPFLRSVLRDMPPGPGRSQLFCVFADSLMALGAEQLPEAIRSYREAVRRPGPFRAQARLGLALAFRRQGQPDWRGQLAGFTERELSRVNTQVFVPEGERAAREAVFWESQDDAVRARAAWELAADFVPWAEFSRAQVEALVPARERRRRR